MAFRQLRLEDVDALLFDVGGVLLNNDFDRMFLRWAEHASCDVAALKQNLALDDMLDDMYVRFERGDIAEKAYFSHLKTLLGIAISDEQILDGWNAFTIGEMPGISALLESAGRKWPLYALTNINTAHLQFQSQRFAKVLSNFRKVFASSTIGLRKPDPALFEHVVSAIGVPASRIMFFDDLPENIESARACGLHAVHVTKSTTVADALAGLATR